MTHRDCVRCGAPADPHSDVCPRCLHLDHGTVVDSCPWCAATHSGPQAAQAAQAAAADAADPEFLHAVTRALAVVRNRREPFTAAEVRATVEGWGFTITHPMAIGAVFAHAHSAGVIRPNGDFVPSPIKGQHGRALRVWVAA